MKKEYLIGGGIVVIGVALYFIFRKKKNGSSNKSELLTDDIKVESTEPTPLKVGQDIIDIISSRANDALQKKRATYEAQWKASGSKLSFKDWYIQNAE